MENLIQRYRSRIEAIKAVIDTCRIESHVKDLKIKLNCYNLILLELLELKSSITPSEWVTYDFNIIETRPPEYGKYLICRKDGKIHWETWNGSGWAYNNNEIRYWAKITPPN